jgi:hypothetical protein
MYVYTVHALPVHSFPVSVGMTKKGEQTLEPENESTMLIWVKSLEAR